MPDLAALDGPAFDVGRLDAGVRDFYEHTAQWRMDAWSQWSAPFLPGGDGRQVWAGWVRRLRSTGDHLFSGAYRATTLPGHGRVVHVAFPLQGGNVQVFLTPSVRSDGALVLDSPRGPFGAPGAYVAVRSEPRPLAASGPRGPVHTGWNGWPETSREVLRARGLAGRHAAA